MYLFCISFRVRRWVEMPVTTVGRERRCSVDGARPHVRRVPRKGPLKRPCLDRKTTQQTIVFRVRRISARSTGTLPPLAAVGTFPGTMKLGKQEEEKEGAASSFLDCSEDDSRSSAAEGRARSLFNDTSHW